MNRPASLALSLSLLTVSAAPVLAQHAGHGGAGRAAPSRVTPPAAKTAPAADPHAGHVMTEPTAAQADPHAGHVMPVAAPAPSQDPADPHAGHDMSTMSAPAADPHAGHAMGAAGPVPEVLTSADTPGRIPQASPPAAAAAGPVHAADLVFGAEAMAASRRLLIAENGDIRTRAVFLDELELSAGDGDGGYAWDAQGWSGGDINRFWWKSEGEGAFDDGLDEVEVQALYSRAISPFFDVQTGLRQTWRPEGDRTDLVLGVQGLAPHWFEVEGALFLSHKGELTARAEVEYDQRITQRVIFQPSLELAASADDIPELSIASGLTSIQIGARLRYEARRELAPYIGVEWTGSLGGTRDLAIARGHSPEDTRVVIGLRAWF